jgi:hypothetical protein
VPHWLLHALGLDNASGPIYLFYSGVFFVLVLLVGQTANAFISARHHNCATRGCWRVGRHRVPGTDHVCCARHTPGGAPTHADILRAHRRARSGESGERMHAEPEQVRCENSAAEVADAQEGSP